MGNSNITSKTAADIRTTGIPGKTENSPVNEPVSTHDDTFNYDTYGETKKSPARIPMTCDQLMQGIIFSEIIGPPVSRRNRFGRK